MSTPVSWMYEQSDLTPLLLDRTFLSLPRDIIRTMRKHSAEELERFFAPLVESSSTWARYRSDSDRADGDGVLVHMPPGEGDRFRDYTKAGRYRCVLLTCDGLFTVHAGDKNVHHWQHRKSPSVEHSAETLWHITAKAVLAEYAQVQHPDAVVHHDDKFTPSRNKPDAWVQWTLPISGSVAFEAQHSKLTTRGLKLRNTRYDNDGIVPVWLFAHHCAPDRTITSEEAVRIRLHEEHKLAADTAPLRWFNPDERLVATGYVRETVRPDLHRGEVWHDETLEKIVYTRHVGRNDTSVRIALDPLDDCVLDAAGLHTPTDRWIESEAARAAQQESQARADYLRRIERRSPTPTSPHSYGPAEPSPPGTVPPRLPMPVVPTRRTDPLVQPCRFCGGLAEARTEWPDWYRPKAGVTEVAICVSCGDVTGIVR